LLVLLLATVARELLASRWSSFDAYSSMHMSSMHMSFRSQEAPRLGKNISTTLPVAATYRH